MCKMMNNPSEMKGKCKSGHCNTVNIAFGNDWLYFLQSTSNSVYFTVEPQVLDKMSLFSLNY